MHLLPFRVCPEAFSEILVCVLPVNMRGIYDLYWYIEVTRQAIIQSIGGGPLFPSPRPPTGLVTCTCNHQSLQAYAFARIFTDFYGCTDLPLILRDSSIIRGKFMACFFIISVEKQATNFPKICAQCTIMLSSGHGHFKFSWNDDTKYRK